MTNVRIEQSKKALKIYLDVDSGEGLNDAILSIIPKSANLISSKLNKSEIIPLKEVIIDKVRHYRPKSQINIVRIAAKVGSSILMFLAALGLISTTPTRSALLIIMTFQRLEFLAYMNVEHPSNLQEFLKHLGLILIERLPNPFSGFKDELCSIEKEKFEEEGVSCYILNDQGRYLTLTILVFTLISLLRIISCITQLEVLRQYLRKNFSWTFWMEYLEAVRFDIFVTVLLSITKIDLLTKETVSWFTFNIFVSVSFGALNILTTLYQFYIIRKYYVGYQKRQSIKRSGNEQSAQTAAIQIFNNNLGRPEERPKKEQQQDEDNKKIKRSQVTPETQLKPAKIDSSKKTEGAEDNNNKLPEKPTSKFNEQYKTEIYYQRNHRPFTALKECLVAAILVVLYDHPIAQTSGITIILLLFLILDIYYRPFIKTSGNFDDIIMSGLFFLLSFLLCLLSFVQRVLTRKQIYFYIGYPAIFVICLLIGRNMYLALYSFMERLFQFIVKNFFSGDKDKKQEKIRGKKKGKREGGEIEKNDEKGEKDGCDLQQEVVYHQTEEDKLRDAERKGGRHMIGRDPFGMNFEREKGYWGEEEKFEVMRKPDNRKSKMGNGGRGRLFKGKKSKGLEFMIRDGKGIESTNLKI